MGDLLRYRKPVPDPAEQSGKDLFHQSFREVRARRFPIYPQFLNKV